MAHDSEITDEKWIQELLHKTETKIKEEQRELLEGMAGKQESCREDSISSITPDLDHLLQTKLLLEGEIEATMESPLLELPQDHNFLCSLAKDETEEAARANARTLEVEALKAEKELYSDMVKKATVVNDALDKLLSTPEKEALEITLRRRHDRAGVVFKSLRTELHFIMNKFYPPKGEGLSVEDLLTQLVTKMLEEPNDPYVSIDNDMKRADITFLIKANLVTRHTTDFTRIRFIDLRN